MLPRLALWCFDRPKRSLAVALGLALLCLWLTVFRLDLQTDWTYLFSSDDPYIQRIEDYRAKFPLPHDIAVLVDGGPEQSRRLLVERLHQRLAAEPERFQHIFSSLDLSLLRSTGFYHLPVEDLAVLARELRRGEPYLRGYARDPRLVSLLALVEEEFRSPDPERRRDALILMNLVLERVEKALAGQDPGLTDELLEMAPDPRARQLLEGQTEFFNTLDDGETFLLLVKPIADDDRISPMGASVTRLRAIVDELENVFPGVRVRVTGEPVLLTDERLTCGQDSLRSSAISLLLIALLFVFGFGEVLRPFIALFSLCVGLLWTLGYTTLVVGHLNFITVTYISMLMGLGIDFGIHLTFRYFEERSRDKEPPEALTITVVGTGVDTFVGALTTGLAFLTMTVTGFQGVAELGIIAGGGVMLCFLSTVTVLPALLAVYERRRGKQSGAHRADWLKSFEDWLMNHSQGLVIAYMLVTFWLVLGIPKVFFDYNLLNIQAPHLESIRTEIEMVERGQTTVLSALTLCPDIETARRRAEALKEKAEIHSVLTPVDLTPATSEKKQKRIEELVRHIATLPELPQDPKLAKPKVLARGLESLRETYSELDWSDPLLVEFSDEFDRRLTELERAYRARGPGPVFDALEKTHDKLTRELRLGFQLLRAQRDQPPTLEQVPEPIQTRFISSDGVIVVSARPAVNVWNREPLIKFTKAVNEVDPHAVGDPILMKHFEDVIETTHNSTVWATLTTVLVVCLLYLRRLDRLLLTFFPTALGLAWMVGLMGHLGIPFNPANFVALPMLVGVGSVFGIHVVHRIHEVGSPRILGISTGPAVLLSALTTMAGFGSLMSAHHRGIASLGFVIAAGMLATLTAALLLLPAIVNITKRKI